MNATLQGINSSSIGSEHTYFAVLADAGEFAGKTVSLNGILHATGPALALANPSGKPTGEVAVPFTRNEGNAEQLRILRKIAPGSAVDVEVSA